MSDLIRRQDALDALYNINPSDDMLFIDAVVDMLENLPSAQPEIIYCKDCKWSDWYDAADGHRYCYCMETGASGRTADDFCSYAEKEEA